ncbi:MAG: hypothetical protein NT013_20875, partial [Planctomycetia bacterium]|nr:hypothetical protein [Planctomycetia bacterium]
GNITIAAASAINLGATDAAGNLAVTSTGAVTDSGDISVTGTTNINAGATDVTLNSAGSTYGGALAVIAKNVAITDTDAGGADLGNITTTGTLSITAGGAVIDSGVLHITGVLTIIADSGNSAITLDSVGNTFGDALNLTGDPVTVA